MILRAFDGWADRRMGNLGHGERDVCMSPSAGEAFLGGLFVELANDLHSIPFLSVTALLRVHTGCE